MSDFTPTPQPWTLAPNGDLLGPDGAKLLVTGVRLFMDGTPAEAAEARANTRLLYLAPRLLAALERLADVACAGEGCADTSYFDGLIAQAEDLIAEAKGGTDA